MNTYLPSHLSNNALMHEFVSLSKDLRTRTATFLAYLAEVDHRKLYVPAAHASMYSYCVHELHMSEETAYRRIHVARAARQFPAIFSALAEGRLNLTAVLLLAPHLTARNADELLAAAVHKTKPGIELLLAERFPKPDLPTLMQPIVQATAPDELALGPVVPSGGGNASLHMEPLALEQVVPSIESKNAAQVEPLLPHSKLTPLSPGRVGWQVTVDQETHEQLLYAKALLGHAVPSGDVAEVLKRALEALVEKLEKQKFAKCARSGPRRSKAKGRYIPAEIRRTLLERDGGQCTFVSEHGKRCDSRTRLEFDHVDEVARGGQTTTSNMRLRCRAHNQFEAERRFGAGFMQEKREEARCKAAREKTQKQAAAKVTIEKDVKPWLRALGFTAQEARRGAELCAHIPDATLEQRVRVAAGGLAPACMRTPAPAASSAP